MTAPLRLDDWGLPFSGIISAVNRVRWAVRSWPHPTDGAFFSYFQKNSNHTSFSLNQEIQHWYEKIYAKIMSSAHIKSVQTEKETWHPSDTQIVYFYSIFSYFLFAQNKGNKKRKSPKTLEALGLFPLVGEDGFEPSKRNAADLQSVPFGHSGTPPYELGCSGACLEPVDGLEPPTYWLQISCSTDWAIPAAQTEHAYYSTGSSIVKRYFSRNAKKLTGQYWIRYSFSPPHWTLKW